MAEGAGGCLGRPQTAKERPEKQDTCHLGAGKAGKRQLIRPQASEERETSER